MTGTTQVGLWKVIFDREATLAAYGRLSVSKAPRCSCQGCRNFRALDDIAFSIDIRNLLDQLGIDPVLPAEIVISGNLEDGECPYSSIFHFEGTLVDDEKEHMSPIGPNGSFFIHKGQGPAQPEAKFSRNILTIEIYSKMKWVLNEAFGGGAS